MKDFLEKYRFSLSVAMLALLCWGGLFTLKGIWWDDWAWLWHYFGSDNFSEFIRPFQSLRHELDAFQLYFNFSLLDIFKKEEITVIWNIWKFLVFIINSLLLYCILRDVLDKKSVLPELICVTYLVSPLINNLCLVELNRRIYLLFFLLSLFFTVKALKRRELHIPTYLLSLLFGFISMRGLENFVFFDLARPLVMFYILRKYQRWNFSQLAKKILLYWFPFALIGIFVLLHGLGVLKPRFGPYAHVYDIKRLPLLPYFYRIIFFFNQSLYYLFASNFFQFIKGLISLKDNFFIMWLSLLSLPILAFLFKDNQALQKEERVRDSIQEAKAMVFFSIFLIFISILPYTIVHWGISFGTSSRHALMASLGISIFIPATLVLIYYKGYIKKYLFYIFFGSFIFISIFQCHAMVGAYQRDWRQQRAFWWQFIWRVPDLKENTYLVVNMPRRENKYLGPWGGGGEYEFSCPLNLLYARSREENQINNHFAQTVEMASAPNKNYSFLNNRDSTEVQLELHNGIIQRYRPKNLILASFDQDCLYLNNEVNKENSGTKINIEPIVANISLNQIIYSETDNLFPFRWIIGPEPISDWHYYLQKAKVLEFKKDFRGIVELYKEAQKKRLTPQFPEVAPLFIIESFYMTGDIKEGNSLLWQWSFSCEGSIKRARELLESLKARNVDEKLLVDLENEVRRIWGKNDKKQSRYPPFKF